MDYAVRASERDELDIAVLCRQIQVDVYDRGYIFRSGNDRRLAVSVITQANAGRNRWI